MHPIGIVILVVCWLAIAFILMLSFKSRVTAKNRDRIYDAIYAYRCAIINEDPWNWTGKNLVRFSDIESYYTTFWRLWDWGCTRILPKDKYEIIKPYLHD